MECKRPDRLGRCILIADSQVRLEYEGASLLLTDRGEFAEIHDLRVSPDAKPGAVAYLAYNAISQCKGKPIWAMLEIMNEDAVRLALKGGFEIRYLVLEKCQQPQPSQQQSEEPG